MFHLPHVGRRKFLGKLFGEFGEMFLMYILVHGFLIIFIRHFIERFKRLANIHAISNRFRGWNIGYYINTCET